MFASQSSASVDASDLAPAHAVDRLRQLGAAPLRGDDELMRPSALGALQPSALSCTRYFVERMFRDGWSIERALFELDGVGAGMARYAITAGNHRFEFIVLSNAPVEGGRSGRVLDGERDMNAGLYEGRATDGQIEAMRREMPKIYSGRTEGDTLIWCRSNRSMRIFEHVVECLSEGRQPDADRIAETGYLMRNVGIEGNGIYGTRAFAAYGADHPLGLPYMAQMLAGYMMREFSFDLAEHLAKNVSANAVSLHRDHKRFIGIGNGSAIGLVFFVYNRPLFIGRWLEMRERLLAAAATLRLQRGAPHCARLHRLLTSAARFVSDDRISESPPERREKRAAELLRFADWVGPDAAPSIDLAQLIERARRSASPEAFDTFCSCAMELLPELRDSLLDCFVVDEDMPPSPTLSLGAFAAIIDRDYGWATDLDTQSGEANHFVWYQSVSNDEPRRGTRADTPEAINMIRNIARDVRLLRADIADFGTASTTAEFLLAHPRHRYLMQRIELLADHRFHTPHGNPFAADFSALTLVRLVMVGFYGLEKSVDFLDRNSRGIMFHGAPARDELGSALEPDWFYPALPVPHP